MKWNPEILSKFVAPGISDFTSATIPDLTDEFPQASYWLVNHFLNSVFRTGFKDRWRQVVIAYLRRAQNAFVAYHNSSEITANYLKGNEPQNPKIGAYFGVVSSWENFALQASMAMDLIRWLNQGQCVFVKNDGTKEQRLYQMANLVKHTASAVSSGQCKESDTLPLWLSNDGLHCFDHALSYAEASEILRELAIGAEKFQDPQATHEKLREEDSM